MLLNLYDVVTAADREKTERANFTSKEISYYGETIKVWADDDFDVVIKHIEKDVVSVSVELTVKVVRSCSRCLEDVELEYPLHIVRNINTKTGEAYAGNREESDEISYIEDCTLDVDMLILDELYTVFPMKVLCKEDCKGICKVCGINLNKSACDCDQVVPDPRMAVFSDIFNQFKEV
jgi:uncharacterized protein